MPWPSCHDRTVNGFPSRYVNLDAARARFGDRVDRLGRFLHEVDPLADRALDAFEALPRGVGWQLFELALREGSGAIPDAPPALRHLIADAEDVPVWVDWERCDRGGELLMRAGPLGGAVLGAGSLVLGYATPAGNKPLVLSGRLKEQSVKRLNETSRFVQAVCRPAGMRPHADGWQITMKVRLIHAQVRRMILRSGRWDAEAWGAPVNQHDMMGTILLFSVAMLDGLRKLGKAVPRDESEDYVHLWRWIGRVIGVHQDILPASETDASTIAELVAATSADPDEDSRALTRALFDAPYQTAKSPEERKTAERQRRFGMTLCREIVGDEMADKLGVERTPLRHAMPMMKRFVAGVERFSRAVPFASQEQVRAGHRYWDRVVDVGLQDATYEFMLPDRLGGLAA